MMERELKLTAVDADTLDQILACDLVTAVCVSDPAAEAISFEAVYYDTEDLQLEAQRCGLRARAEGEVLRAAMKLPGEIIDGLSERIEFEATLESWPETFNDFPRGDLFNALSERISMEAKMVARVRVSMSRRIRMLELEGAKIELVTDHGLIKGLNGEQQLDEIELELKQGGVAPMLALGESLKSRFGLTYSTTTKLGIGLSLC